MNVDDNRARFTNVVVPHLSEAYSLARWLTGDRADAEDVVQEACLRAFRGIDAFAGLNARAWVLTIVRNTAYSWLGKNRSFNLLAVEDLGVGERAQAEQGGEAGAVSTTPEDALIAKADAARVEAAMAALPTQFREMLVLRDVHDLEYREIAEVTSVPLGTVMSRLARARRRLIAAIRTDE